MALEQAEAPKRACRAARLWSTWGPVIGTAVVYFVAARLAMRMVSHYGYATAVWPAAGLSLASVLRFGRRVSPGIWLGAFAGNVGSSFGAGVPPSTAGSLAVAAWIAVGCTLQALVGASLVRRYVREPELLADDRDIWMFCLLSGPLASVVSATWANVTLVSAGLAPLGAFPIGWATWWVGDTIGVLIFAPLALILARSEEPWRRRRLPIGVSLLVSFALVTALFFRVSRWEQARLDLQLARRGEIIAHAIELHARPCGVVALSPVRADALIAAALQHIDHRGLQIVVEDEAAPESERLLYTDGPDGPLKWRTVLDVGGQRWSLGIAPAVRTSDLEATWSPWVVLVGGLCFVGLLGILLLVLLGRAARMGLVAAERARLVEELRAAVALRDDFLAIAAHELRTPLTSLILQIQLAGRQLRDGGSGNLAVRIEQASRQAGRLGRLVDDLLNASRLTAGRLTLTREPCDLAEITSEVVARHEADARKAGCAIGLRATGKTDGLWDQARLEQVVTNLLTNALKFGGGKPVELAVHGDEEVVTLTVRDHGPGIPAEAVQRIFGKFERAVSARSYGGLGLGLYIALEIVEAHGGSLAVDSVPGEGATFTLRLPKAPVVVETAG